MTNKKMAAVIGRLRFDWMRRRGVFLRPRRVSADAWKRACRTYGVAEAMRRAEAGLM
jgi:hypothetical protein